MNAKIRRELDRRKRRSQFRLEKAQLKNLDKPVYTASNIRYDFAPRGRGIAHGGIGAFHLLARRIGLIDAIDDNLHLLKIHLPYHESDHVLNPESEPPMTNANPLLPKPSTGRPRSRSVPTFRPPEYNEPRGLRLIEGLHRS